MSIIALRCFPLYYLKINRRYLHYCFDREWTNEYEDPNRPSVGQDPNLLAMHMDQFDVTDADLQPSTSATEINEVSDAHPTLGEEYPSEFPRNHVVDNISRHFDLYQLFKLSQMFNCVVTNHSTGTQLYLVE